MQHVLAMVPRIPSKNFVGAFTAQRHWEALAYFPAEKVQRAVNICHSWQVARTGGCLQRVREGNESAETVGVTVALTIADKLLSRLPDCKNEIYTLLADVSGKTPAEIAALDMGVFAEAVFDLMASEDFRDFFTRLMKRLGQTK